MNISGKLIIRLLSDSLTMPLCVTHSQPFIIDSLWETWRYVLVSENQGDMIV
jgi:hypothetical protein